MSLLQEEAVGGFSEAVRLTKGDTPQSYRRFVIFGVIVAAGMLAAIIAVATREAALDSHHSPHYSVPLPQCTHPVFCTGPLLAAVQLHPTPLFPDSKTFVDMPILASSPQVVLDAFASQSSTPNFDLAAFVAQYFGSVTADLVSVVPSDFQSDPPAALLDRIVDPNLKNFATDVHRIWKNLTRAFNRSGFCDDCTSTLPYPNPFVVPGGRFRESYYWDTYWILEGLFLSNMTTTAKGIIENFMSAVMSNEGFVPNGGRVYYLDRSQPPLLTQMVSLYVNHTGDTVFLRKAVPVLMREHQFWMQTHLAPMAPPANGGSAAVLNRYVVSTNGPRPESYREDVATAQNAPGRPPLDVYNNLAAGAETGWDYSSRWLDDAMNLSTITASHVVPADLNAILLRNEELIASWLCNPTLVGVYNRLACDSYTATADLRRESILTYLWTGEKFVDFDWVANRTRSVSWYPSDIVPLTVPSIAARLTAAQQTSAIASLRGLMSIGGVPTSQLNTTQQWDFTNAWPPLQYFSMLALEAAGSLTSAQLLAQKWTASNYCGFQATGHMYEKYTSNAVGVSGGGGEYTPQDGFGWTNGVLLWALNRYGGSLSAPTMC